MFAYHPLRDHLVLRSLISRNAKISGLSPLTGIKDTSDFLKRFVTDMLLGLPYIVFATFLNLALVIPKAWPNVPLMPSVGGGLWYAWHLGAFYGPILAMSFWFLGMTKEQREKPVMFSNCLHGQLFSLFRPVSYFVAVIFFGGKVTHYDHQDLLHWEII